MKPRVALVGFPNVGKSALFGRLTGLYVAVSNYPGTTVEVARGGARFGATACEVIDTPGLYSVWPVTEEERVALAILTAERPALVVHVIDAKNLERMLPLTFELVGMGHRVVVILNMFDEARARGMTINTRLLSERLGVPVVATVAVEREGIEHLSDVIAAELARGLPSPEPHGPPPFSDLRLRRSCARAAGLARRATIRCEAPPGGRQRLDRWLLSPLTGLPILAAVVIVLLYLFVGKLGAGVVVDLLESWYEALLSPLIVRGVNGLIPWPAFASLFSGEYGILTLGVRYAAAIILPIIAFFFFAFALLEDSGYLPRIAFLLDRAFKRIGLSGRAIIPMVLGLGCVSMGTMVVRTLPTRRERMIATVLLALCIPCSAQLGVIMGLLSERLGALALWAAVIAFVFAAAGFLLARLAPGARPFFVIELPPMRLPRPANVLAKTWMRLEWYFKEIVPLFVIASAIIWGLEITGGLGALLKSLAAPLAWMGLPGDAAPAFLFGFFRRDYGAAGLYDLARGGGLSGEQLAVACVVLTLFLPCITQLLVMMRERGWKMGMALAGAVLTVAVSVGIVLHAVLAGLGVSL